MRIRTLPVVLARWFRDGVGYAYGPEVDSELLAAVMSALRPVSQRDRDHTFQFTLPDGRILVGARDADTTPLDALAEGRRPYVIRTAICPAQSSDHDAHDALTQLRALRLPNRPGLSGDLTVRLVPPSEPPALPLPAGRLFHLAPWVLAISFVTADLVLWQMSRSDGAVGLLIRSVVLLSLVSASELLRKLPTAEELGRLEWQWYADAEPGRGAFRLQPGARIVLPDGGELASEQETTLLAAGVRRIPSSQVIYHEVDVSPGAATVAGTEAITFAGQEMTAAFTRRYAFWKGRWWLSYAQWTVVRGIHA